MSEAGITVSIFRNVKPCHDSLTESHIVCMPLQKPPQFIHVKIKQCQFSLQTQHVQISFWSGVEQNKVPMLTVQKQAGNNEIQGCS